MSAIQLSQSQNIALVLNRLGDSLLTMVVVNNLLRNGFDVTVFGNYIHALKNWFPGVKIQPLPKLEETKQVLAKYDVVFLAYHADNIGDVTSWHSQVRVFDDWPTYRQCIPMPDIQVAICEKELRLKNVMRTNGLISPPDLQHRKNKNRVVIHTTSLHMKKNWLPKRFLHLARSLQQRGLQPEFIVGPHERADWEWAIVKGIPLPAFNSLDETARWIYESGWFMGNDSGLGHLASNLGIPTVTLAMRAGIAKRWRPSWADGEVVLPPKWLFIKQLKESFWKYFVSVNQVLFAFDNLVKRDAENVSP